MKAAKIIAGITLLGVCALAYLAIRFANESEYWQNFKKTEAARNARHQKKEDPQPEAPETETEKTAL